MLQSQLAAWAAYRKATEAFVVRVATSGSSPAGTWIAADPYPTFFEATARSLARWQLAFPGHASAMTSEARELARWCLALAEVARHGPVRMDERPELVRVLAGLMNDAIQARWDNTASCLIENTVGRPVSWVGVGAPRRLLVALPLEGQRVILQGIVFPFCEAESESGVKEDMKRADYWGAFAPRASPR
jgi:hypothetical protein